MLLCRVLDTPSPGCHIPREFKPAGRMRCHHSRFIPVAFQESPSRSRSQPRAFPGRSFVLPTPQGGRRCPGCHSHVPAFAGIMEGGSTGGQKLRPEDGLTPWDPGLPSQSFPG